MDEVEHLRRDLKQYRKLLKIRIDYKDEELMHLLCVNEAELHELKLRAETDA